MDLSRRSPSSLAPPPPLEPRDPTQPNPTAVPVPWGAPFLRDSMIWALHIATVVGALGLLVDGTLLLARRESWLDAGCGALSSASLAVLVALPFAPLFTASSRAVRWLNGRRSRLRVLSRWWPSPIFLAALFIGYLVMFQVETHEGARGGIVVVFGLIVATLAMPAPVRSPIANAIALTVGAAALATDIVFPKIAYREMHDLLALLTVTSLLVATYGLRQGLRQRPTRALGAALLLLVAGSLGWVRLVDSIAPGWRAASTAHGRYAMRLARLARALVDLDGDGYSAVAWGGDCDDFDSSRHPLVNDESGAGDRNCNGADPPRHPRDVDRGLAPAAGSPDLADPVDTVLLVTVDCLRDSALTDENMPRLSELSRRGLRLLRTYSAASSTRDSTMLIERGTNAGVPTPRRLHAAGVSSAALVGLRENLFDRAVVGFDRVVRPPVGRFSADELAQQTIAVLDATRRPAYVWVHFYDAHTPYSSQVMGVGQLTGVSTASLWPRYLERVRSIDAAIGRLVDHLRDRGRLARTVILVTGDHGEAFGEHDVALHHVSAYEAVVRVPAVLVAPTVLPGRTRQLATHRDIPATVLGAFGRVAADPTVEEWGRSWFRLRDAPEAPLHQFVIVRSGRAVSGNTSLSPLIAIVEDRWKLVRGLEDNLVELFDVEGQPDEPHDLLPLHRDVAGRLLSHQALARDLDRWPTWPQPVVLRE